MYLSKNNLVIGENRCLGYYECCKDSAIVARDKSSISYPNLLLLHAQGTYSSSFNSVLFALAKHFHVYMVDYYGHGMSSHNKDLYNLVSIGEDLIYFIDSVIKSDIIVLGHSSGGLIGAYIAANCDKCVKLILEDAPFFSCVGERRFNTYNYVDLSSVCHNFLNQSEIDDFVYYYFREQYCWNFFPEKNRDIIKEKSCASALKYREKYPDKALKVRFWPKKFLLGFNGMQYYDPLFGESFYNDSFHNGVDYRSLLSSIKCPTLFMKAESKVENGLLLGALSDSDLKVVVSLLSNSRVEYFPCGHGIHIDMPKLFIDTVKSFK